LLKLKSKICKIQKIKIYIINLLFKELKAYKFIQNKSNYYLIIEKIHLILQFYLEVDNLK